MENLPPHYIADKNVYKLDRYKSQKNLATAPSRSQSSCYFSPSEELSKVMH